MRDTYDMSRRAFFRRACWILLALSIVGSAAHAQCTIWEQEWGEKPSSRMYAPMAAAPDGHTLFFGGTPEPFGPYLTGTWSWTHVGWALAVPTSSPLRPPGRFGASMAYDSQRGRVVLFGGYGGNWLADTWEWDGSTWSQQSPSLSPPARVLGSMTYDPERHRCVLFGGGQAANTPLQDTWEWDGTTWTRVSLTGPSSRQASAMTFDAARHRVVLFGGYSQANTALGDTWEWDGAGWAQVPGPGPSARQGAAMTYDPIRSSTILFGGAVGAPWSDGSTGLSDTWKYQDGVWSQLAAPGPAGRFGHAMAFHAATARPQMFGGFTLANGTFDDTWEWDGAAWIAVAPQPEAREFHAMVFDQARGRMLLFAGAGNYEVLADTWEWDGAAWSLRATNGPTARCKHDMAYDPVRNRTVLFGGANSIGNALGDTWEWDGAAWTQRATTGPSARYGHRLVYSPLNGGVLLVGGETYTNGSYTYYGDTWLWDGTQWNSLPAPPLPMHDYRGLSFDPDRQRIVLVAGYGTNAYFAWEWDGSSWAAPSTAYVTGNGGVSSAFDPVRHRTVLFDSRIHEWDGSAWSQRSLLNTNISRLSAPVVIDPARGRAVVFGGDDIYNSVLRGDTNELALTTPATIAAQPQSVTIPNGRSATFSVTAAGDGPFTYQWRTPSGLLADGQPGLWLNGGIISGVTTPTLTFIRAGPNRYGSTGTVGCVVTNSCGGVSSNYVTLTILPCASADFDNDGDPGTDADIAAFFACLAGNCCDTCPRRADFNGDGDVGTDQDIESFFRVLGGGSC